MNNQKSLFLDDEKVASLEREVKFLKAQLRDMTRKCEKAENKILLLEEKLRKEGNPVAPFRYVMKNYKQEYELIVKVLNKHNVQIRNKARLAKNLILLLEGDKQQKPLFTKSKLITYLNLIDKFTLEEYRKIKFAPIISSEYVLFDKYEQIVKTLKQEKKQVQHKQDDFIFERKDLDNVEIKEQNSEFPF